VIRAVELDPYDEVAVASSSQASLPTPRLTYSQASAPAQLQPIGRCAYVLNFATKKTEHGNKHGVNAKILYVSDLFSDT